MSRFSGKKFLLFGFIAVLLVAIPITVYLVKQQQQSQSSAIAATTLSFLPQNISVKPGDTVSLDIFVEPTSSNAVSLVKIMLTYDPTTLATSSAGVTVNSWTLSDGSSFTPALVDGPNYGDGTLSFSLNTGTSPQSYITTKTKIATVSFKTSQTTEQGIPTQVVFGNQSQVLSSTGDNILSSSGAPANITVNSTSLTATPTVTPTPVTSAVTSTPTPTVAPSDGGSLDGTDLNNLEQDLSTTLECTNLSVTPSTSGVAPFSVNFTATGSSSGSAITKVTFDFGDGQVKEATDSGGIGTDAISVLTNHTYANAGTYDAQATLTDANGDESLEGCTATINVSSSVNSTPTQAAPSPLPPTGPTSIVTLGAIGAMLFFIGAVLLFAL